MADALHLAGVDRPRFEQLAQTVGQLDLPGPVALDRGQRGKDVGRQNVAADNRQVGRRFVARRFLDQIAHPIDAVAELRRRVDVDHAVARDVFGLDAFDGEHRPADALEHVDHLLDRRRLRVDHVVGEDHGERLVADEIAADQHGVAEAERLSLPDVREIDHVRDLADLVQLVAFAARLEERLELHRYVEVIFDRVLAAPGDENDVVDAGSDRLLDAVLDDRLVDQRQHFLRLRFGGGKKSRAETGHREDRLADDGSHGRIVAEVLMATRIARRRVLHR